MANTYLAQCRRAYERDRNPIMAWRAYWWARAEDERVPRWVLDYLDDVANNLLEEAAVSHTRPKNDQHADARIARALGLKGRGPHTMMRRDRTAVRDSLIIAEIKHEQLVAAKRGEALSKLRARTAVGRRWHMSQENIKSIVERRR